MSTGSFPGGPRAAFIGYAIMIGFVALLVIMVIVTIGLIIG